MVELSTRGNPRESATETNRQSSPSHVNGGPARVKWCGKSAPAPRRRGGWANPTRCKAKADRSQAARQDPGRPHRWMVLNDRIRLIDLLRKSPAPAGFFYGVSSWRLNTLRRLSGSRGDFWDRSARAPGPWPAALRTARQVLAGRPVGRKYERCVSSNGLRSQGTLRERLSQTAAQARYSSAASARQYSVQTLAQPRERARCASPRYGDLRDSRWADVLTCFQLHAVLMTWRIAHRHPS